jgi:hypothetical protein
VERGKVKAVKGKEGGDRMKAGTGERSQMGAMEEDVGNIAKGRRLTIYKLKQKHSHPT